MVLRRVIPLVLVAFLVGAVSGCGDDGDDKAAETGTTTTASTASTTDGTGTTTTDPAGTPSTSEATATTDSVPFAGDEEPKVGEPDDLGTAQLVDVRVGEQPGATRLVLEFAGEAQPGYDVRWVDGPITEDASGDPVDIEGETFLQVLVQPASGFDMEAGVPTYEGPDRLAGPAGGAITEAVSTGDFEALLTWVLGAEERAPFTVLALDAPSRLVIDIQNP